MVDAATELALAAAAAALVVVVVVADEATAVLVVRVAATQGGIGRLILTWRIADKSVATGSLACPEWNKLEAERVSGLRTMSGTTNGPMEHASPGNGGEKEDEEEKVEEKV